MSLITIRSIHPSSLPRSGLLVGFIGWLGGVISVKIPNRRPIELEGPVQQHCLLGPENKSNDPLLPTQPHARSGLQPDAIAPSTPRDPQASPRTQHARLRSSHGKERLCPVRHSCEDQTPAGLHRHSGKPPKALHVLLPLTQAPRDKTAPRQPNPPHTKPSQRLCSAAS